MSSPVFPGTRHGSTKEVSRAIQTVPFSLSSSASSGSSVDSHAVQVHAAEADYSQVLTKVESRFDHVDRGVGASILSVVSGHKTTGYEYIEEVLPVAQFVTVLGKVSLVQNSLVVSTCMLTLCSPLRLRRVVLFVYTVPLNNILPPTY